MKSELLAVLTVREAAQLLRLSLPSVYTGISNGEIPSIRVGRRILVPRIALEAFLARAGERER
ncbi:MAG: helix-turn-helix domain-containing protein [Armatimonadetes bacterium]|nr:helix-turn-helix domain-containing protein [Armatimonadota bacterium]